MHHRFLSTLVTVLAFATLPLGCLQREVGETKPQTSNIFVRPTLNSPIDKIDLLFVVDNSSSMGDKQAIFGQAVPRMLERLIREGEARGACLDAAVGAESELAPGFCYVDPDAGLGSASLVASCTASERRLLRFVGKDTPRAGATMLVACSGGPPVVRGL